MSEEGENFGQLSCPSRNSAKRANKILMKPHQTKIACIGWGSLIMNPGNLPRRNGWHRDGPMLRVEFARESAGHKITLVICKDVLEIQTLWTLLDVEDIATAKQKLGLREYDAAKPKWIEANIGFWDKSSGTSHGEGADAIAAWAEARDLEGVVWTNLDCGFQASRGVMPTGEQIIAYLRALQGAERAAAEEYIRQTPHQVSTAYRKLICAELNWD